ncbi:hypothetical protein PVAP13_3KG142200 [Panicum virgatum]|uniref:Jacalin-type lectin domain-containing protein n=1 Tax=Panicum virgatum TaxID=38727 RepID=A0A8T0UUF6_PANVG|nr:hypothetical protein PVAP13_3KG142200 [Panicum virgatum]
MVGLVKIGPWGGRGGDPRDIVAAGVTPLRLESIVIRGEGAVDSISFTYAGVDGVPRKAGPWGGSGGRKYKVMFGATEVIKEVSGTYGPFGGHACVVRSLTFPGGTPFSVPVQDGGRVVGFFGSSGWLLDAVGVYVHP